MPLPSAEIQAFAPPTVKAGVLTQPVTLAGEVHGLRAPVETWREIAWAVLAASPAKPRPQSTQVGKSPILKPNRRIL